MSSLFLGPQQTLRHVLYFMTTPTLYLLRRSPRTLLLLETSDFLIHTLTLSRSGSFRRSPRDRVLATWGHNGVDTDDNRIAGHSIQSTAQGLFLDVFPVASHRYLDAPRMTRL